MKYPSTFHIIAFDDRLSPPGPVVFDVEAPRPGEETSHGAAIRAKARVASLNRGAYLEKRKQRYEVVEYVPRPKRRGA